MYKIGDYVYFHGKNKEVKSFTSCKIVGYSFKTGEDKHYILEHMIDRYTEDRLILDLTETRLKKLDKILLCIK